MRTIATIENCPIQEDESGCVFFTAKMAIDNDGSDNRQGDKFFQSDTSLHHDGRPINSEAVPGIAVPPAIIRGVKGIVLGCRVRVTYNGHHSEAVVFDVGPKAKLGEGSPALARRLNINPSAINGGVDAHEVLYELWPGVPAVVDGITYTLKPS